MDSVQNNQALTPLYSNPTALQVVGVKPETLPPGKYTDSERKILSLALPTKNEQGLELNPVVASYNQESLAMFAQKLIKRANDRFGNRPDENTLSATLLLIIENLKTLSTFRKKEVENILEMGLNGELDPKNDPVRHFSSVVFMRWVKTYESLRLIPNAIKANYAHKKEEEVEPEEVKKRLEDCLNYFVELVTKNEEPKSFQAIDEIYTKSLEVGIFDPLTPGEKNDIMQAIWRLTGLGESPEFWVFCRKVSYMVFVYQSAFMEVDLEKIVLMIHKNQKTLLESATETMRDKAKRLSEQYRANLQKADSLSAENRAEKKENQ